MFGVCVSRTLIPQCFRLTHAHQFVRLNCGCIRMDATKNIDERTVNVNRTSSSVTEVGYVRHSRLCHTFGYTVRGHWNHLPAFAASDISRVWPIVRFSFHFSARTCHMFPWFNVSKSISPENTHRHSTGIFRVYISHSEYSPNGSICAARIHFENLFSLLLMIFPLTNEPHIMLHTKRIVRCDIDGTKYRCRRVAIIPNTDAHRPHRHAVLYTHQSSVHVSHLTDIVCRWRIMQNTKQRDLENENTAFCTCTCEFISIIRPTSCRGSLASNYIRVISFGIVADERASS